MTHKRTRRRYFGYALTPVWGLHMGMKFLSRNERSTLQVIDRPRLDVRNSRYFFEAPGTDAAMQEIWLGPNRRALWFGCAAPLVVVAIGAWLLFGTVTRDHRAWQTLGAVFLAGGLAVCGYLLVQIRRPRVALRERDVLFYLRRGGPIAVPVEYVEAFFLGQSDTPLPGSLGRQQTANLVARISQRAADWQRQEVNPSLGSWCNGYVTIRGTWCEPLGNDVIRRLNRRLKEVQTAIVDRDERR
jgi:hypothetical protein